MSGPKRFIQANMVKMVSVFINASPMLKNIDDLMKIKKPSKKEVCTRAGRTARPQWSLDFKSNVSAIPPLEHDWYGAKDGI